MCKINTIFLFMVPPCYMQSRLAQISTKSACIDNASIFKKTITSSVLVSAYYLHYTYNWVHLILVHLLVCCTHAQQNYYRKNNIGSVRGSRLGQIQLARQTVYCAVLLSAADTLIWKFQMHGELESQRTHTLCALSMHFQQSLARAAITALQLLAR